MNDDHFEITLRRDSRGGRVARKLKGNEEAFDPRKGERERFVLLVHGFNASEDEAFEAFDRFKGAMLQIAPALEKDIGYVFWPGDYYAGPGSGVYRWAVYPRRVRTAIQCASELAGYIRKRISVNRKPPEFVFVAHSLGCRLVIEALSLLSIQERQSVRLILMAAAYPVNLVASAKAPGTSQLKSSLVLFSKADAVLRVFFPPGERLARTSGNGWPEAVGLRGLPLLGPWTERAEMSGFDHDRYWKSSDVQEEVCRFLGFTVAISQPIRQLRSAPLLRRTLPPRWLRSRDRGR